MKLNEKLIMLRKTNGLSQEELAEKINVSRQAVSRWESGTTFPDIPNLINICKLFNVSADFLINDDHSENHIIADKPNGISNDKSSAVSKLASEETVQKQTYAVNKKSTWKACLTAVSISSVICIISALLFYTFQPELSVFLLPALVIAFPILFLNLVKQEILSFRSLIITSFIFLLIVNAINLSAFWVSYQLHFGSNYTHLILWNEVLCFLNISAFLSLNGAVLFLSPFKKRWVNVLTFTLNSIIAFVLVCFIKYTSAPPIAILIICILLFIVSCAARCLSNRKSQSSISEI